MLRELSGPRDGDSFTYSNTKKYKGKVYQALLNNGNRTAFLNEVSYCPRTVTLDLTSVTVLKTGKVAAVAGFPARSRFFARFVRGS